MYKVAAVLDDPELDPIDHLRSQHAVLTDRLEQLQAMVTALEKTMEARKMGISLTPDEQFEVFGAFDPGASAEEVEERWGGTDAYRQSQRRTAAYTKADWLAIKEEGGDAVVANADRS